MDELKTRYYFYGHIASSNWYTFTTETLRKAIQKNNSAAYSFVFTGVCSDTPRKEDAEDNYRSGENLINCKEPACMLKARREFFEDYRKRIIL